MKSSVKKLQAITLLLAFFLTSCNSATSPSNNQEKMSTPTPNKVIATSPKSIRKTTTQTPNRSISIHPESQEETITPTSNITITASPEPSVALIRKHLNCAGKMIAFVSDRDGNDEIYLMCDDGSQQTNISLHPAKDTNPIWSPDGSKLAFESIRNNPNFGECTIGCAGNIYIYDLSNLELNLISDIYGTDPSWSPDGSRIAFRHFYYGEDENLYSDIYLVNSDGSNLRNLTNHKSINFFPIWSPQADQILFFSDREFEYSYESFESSMYVADSDGSNLTNLVQTNHADASWSPDGTQVVFVDGRHSPATDIYVMSIDGTGLKQLTSSNRYEWNPRWSPNGSFITYVYGCENGVGCEIWLVDTQSWSYSLLMTTVDDLTFLDMSWSSDSKKILFVDKVKGELDIFSINIESSEIENLTRAHGIEYSPAMQP